MKACFIGLGYVGLPTAIIAADNGIEVIGVDINPEVVKSVNSGKVHFSEPGLNEICKKVTSNGNFKAYTEPQTSDVYVIVVPTPFKGNHEPDILYVESAVTAILPYLKEGNLCIIESTCPVGTTEKMAGLIFSEKPALKDKIYLSYCPERVLPGNTVYELIHNDRVIGGIDEGSSEKAAGFYSHFVEGSLYKTNAHTAEMCKLTENASRDVQIAFANELSIICEKAHINVWELIELANKHPRVNILQPGCGVGGHCIAVDPYFITANFPRESHLIATARKTNNYKTFWCVEKIKNVMLQFEINRHRKPKIAMMGLAFKPNIDDLRESPAKAITVKIMQTVNNTDLMVVEPNVKEHNVFKLTNYKEAYETADIVVFLVNHKEFAELDYRKDVEILDFCGTFKNHRQ